MVLIIGNISVLSRNAIDSEGMEQIFHALFYTFYFWGRHTLKKSQREMRDKQKN